MKKRSLLFQTSTLPRKQVTETKIKSISAPIQKQVVMTKSESKKSSSREGGGIPRPQGGGVSASPSKLAVRTNTNKVSMNPSVNPPSSMSSKHEQVMRTASGDAKVNAQTQSAEGPYKLHPASVAYRSGGGQRTLVNDKLYPRIPHPGPPLFHPSAPQRSQTLSMIPSHSSSRTKMGSNVPAKVPNMPGGTQVRFGPPIGDSSQGSRMPAPSQYSAPPHNVVSNSGQPIKGIMKADRLSGDIPGLQPVSQSQPVSSSQQTVPYSQANMHPSVSSHSHAPVPSHPSYPQGQMPNTKNVGPVPVSGYQTSASHSGSYPPNSSMPSQSVITMANGPGQGQGNHPNHPSVHQMGPGHHNQLNGPLQQQGHMKIPQSNHHMHEPPHFKGPHNPGSSYPGQRQGPHGQKQIPPSSYHSSHVSQFMHPSHPAHPTPPPYHQPPQPPPNTINNDGPNIRNESDEFAINNAELNKRLASAKSDLKRLATENGSIVSEYSKKIQDQQTEIRNLKELNARLSEDNQELRDLCCFLDDDRQKGRKLAREWQRFGRYTASVMRQEVSNYQSKLKDLAGKQDDLIRDNLELKELCLYLDEERAGGVTVCTECGGPLPPTHPPLQAVRDEGDGSSSSTNNDESEISGSNLVEELNAVNARENLYLKGNKMGLNDEVLLYIRNLEDRVGQLEAGSEYPLSTQFNQPFRNKIVKDLSLDHISDNIEKDMGSRPESVTNAMKVLEVHEQILEKSLDSDEASDELGDGEKALVREMCNVVWRKLEEG